MIFSCYASNRSPLAAARFFAEIYFEECREVAGMTAVGDHWIFSLVDGVASYRLDYRAGSPPHDPPAYVVSRMTRPFL